MGPILFLLHTAALTAHITKHGLHHPPPVRQQHYNYSSFMAVWLSGSALVSINKLLYVGPGL